MNSATSTKSDSVESAAAPVDSGFRPWHFYLPLSMVGATVAVAVSRHTHPVALVLLSAAVVAAGLVGLALHRALAGFWSTDDGDVGELPVVRREELEREKSLILRSIKELEFDHKMGKIKAADFESIGERLRARAITLMAELETAERPARTVVNVARPAEDATRRSCESCSTSNDIDAQFCKRCGHRMGTAS